MAKKNSQAQNAAEYIENTKLYNDLPYDVEHSESDWDNMPTITQADAEENQQNVPVEPEIITADLTLDDRPAMVIKGHAEYDDGTPVEPENQEDYIVTVDNAPAVVIKLQELLLHEAVRLASCEGGDCIEDDTQFGSKIFTLDEVILYCYRLEIAKSDAEIAAFVKAMEKQGALMKAGRGKYEASAIMRMSLKDVRSKVEKKLTSL